MLIAFIDALARPAHRLVGADLARADHVRRRSARGRASSSRARAWQVVRGRSLQQRAARGACSSRRRVAVPFGVLMALPALRLQGLYLALATMAFARMAEFVIFDQPEVFGGAGQARRADSSSSASGSTSRSRCSASTSPQTPAYAALRHRAVRHRRARRGRAAARRVRPPARGDARQPGRVRDARREPVLDQARGLRDLGRDRRLRAARSTGMLPRAPRRRQTSRCSRACRTLLLLVVGGVVGGERRGVRRVRAPVVRVARPCCSPDVRAHSSGGSGIGPGLAGIGIGRHPDGAVVESAPRCATKRIGKQKPLPAAHAGPGTALRPSTPTAAAGRAGTAVRLAMALLEVHDVSVRFGGLQALDAVSFDVEPTATSPGSSARTARARPRCSTSSPGCSRRAAGSSSTARTSRTRKPHRRARLGMGRTFQRLETFGTLSVRDNVLVAAEMRRGWSRDKSDPAAVTDEMIERIGLGAVARRAGRHAPDRHRAPRRGGARAGRASRGCCCSTSRRPD